MERVIEVERERSVALQKKSVSQTV